MKMTKTHQSVVGRAQVLLQYTVTQINSGIPNKRASNKSMRLKLKAAVILVFIMGNPVIIQWGDYSTFDIPTAVLKAIQQL